MAETLRELTLSDGLCCATIEPQQQELVEQQGMNTEYIITVKTGDLTNAGTDGEVKIQVIGKSLLWTEPTVLDHAFDNDFEQNQTTRYSVTMKDIREPIVCKILIADKGYSADWYVDYITVNVHGKDFYFPCYEWITNGFITPNSTTALPHVEENDALKQFRSESLSKEQSKHSWAEAEDIVGLLTGHLTAANVEELPRNDQWTSDRTKFTEGKKAMSV